jgi:phosphatidylserine/phosphatidylglycerophosphate/cardiolipin synthase-like enzyme
MRILGAIGLGLVLAACGVASDDGDDADVALDEAAATGGERVDPAGAELPSCASPLMRSIFDATKPVIAKGSVPGRLFASGQNAPSATALLNGPEIFPAMGALIEDAKREVDLTFYVWEADSQPASELLDAIKRLEERRKSEAAPGDAPVVVRVLLDVSAIGFGSSIKMMPALGAGIERLGLDERYVKVETSLFLHRVLGNVHIKTLVVDGRASIITGANVQKHHDYEAPWYDMGFRFEGEVSRALLADFDWHWAHSSARRWTCGSQSGSASDCQKPAEKIVRPATTLDLGAAEGRCSPAIVATRLGDWTSGMNSVQNPQNQAFLSAFANARQKINVHTPNLNDDDAKDALVEAVVKNPGVRVRVVLSKGFNDMAERMPGQGGDNATNVAELYTRLRDRGLDASQACLRLQVRWYSFDGTAPVEGNGARAAHAKYASFDDQVAIVGTANMDTQSWNHAHETNVVLDDAAVVKRWDAKVFDASFARGIVADQCQGVAPPMKPSGKFQMPVGDRVTDVDGY